MEEVMVVLYTKFNLTILVDMCIKLSRQRELNGTEWTDPLPIR